MIAKSSKKLFSCTQLSGAFDRQLSPSPADEPAGEARLYKRSGPMTE